MYPCRTDTAFKWLHKPMAKSDVKANGQKAVKNLIDIGNKVNYYEKCQFLF